MSPRIVLAALLSALALCAAQSSTAFGCDHCGCAAPCQKTCRLVCETKKVEITCWGCKCEDFCIPGPSKPCCKHCEMVCDDCDHCAADGVRYQPHKFVWTEWIPGCAKKIQTRKKLMKKTVTKTIPSYKWVVENLCPQCQAHAQSVAVPTGTELPQLPALAAAARVLPVGTAPAVADEVVYNEVDVDGSVQPASFDVPLPQAPMNNAAPTSFAPKSWRGSFKLPWER